MSLGAGACVACIVCRHAGLFIAIGGVCACRYWRRAASDDTLVAAAGLGLRPVCERDGTSDEERSMVLEYFCCRPFAGRIVCEAHPIGPWVIGPVVDVCEAHPEDPG